MVILKKHSKELFEFYKTRPDFFPIIGAVIEGKQKGTIYANDINNPTSFFVAHSFHFAQYIEIEEDLLFDKRLKENIFSQANFKFRVYNPPPKWQSYFKQVLSKSCKVLDGTRERFVFNKKSEEISNQIIELNEDNFIEINELFELMLESRFWPTKKEAISNANLVALSVNDNLVSTCYGAAVSDHRIEIDVATLPAERKKGYAEKVVRHFITMSQSKGLISVWDCYSDNISSVKLAQKVGFSHILQYPFFILTR